MTNAERIRTMTDEELLQFLYGMPNSCMDDDIERCDVTRTAAHAGGLG